MRIFPVVSATLLALFVAADPVATQEEDVRKSDIVRLLAELPRFSPIRDDMVALGFQGEKLELAVMQITRMLRDPQIANNIAERVIAAQDPSIRSAEAGGLFWPLVDRGLGHLPARELRYFYQVEQTMLKALTDRQCGLVIKERLPPGRLAKVTGRVAARLNTAALKEYYRIQFKAAKLGATREPNRLKGRDEARAINNINDALGRSLAGRSDADHLMRAYEDLGRVGNRRACEAGRVFMDAVLSLEGRNLHHALILLSTPLG